MKKIICLALTLLIAISAVTFAASADFADVSSDRWYYEEVASMADKGYLRGYSDGNFYPEYRISRAEFVVLIARLAGLSDSQGQTSHWAAGTLQAALESGWYDWDEIPPTGELHDEPVSRQLAVKIMMRALSPDSSGDWSISETIMDFADLDGRYYNEVLAAYSEGLVNGDNKGNFNPQDNLKRAEASVLLWRALSILDTDPAEVTPTPSPAPPTEISGGVSENGALSVIGTQLSGEDGDPVVLRGMSSHGMQWYGEYANYDALKTLTEYGANLFRVAMYTAENGYISNPDAIKKQVISAVDAAIANDMYVIIDWHILYDNNPNTYKSEAKTFFAEMAELYKDEPAVIYEICNEPNGDVTWERDIRPYAMELIPLIREHAPESIVIVGTGTWSQDVDKVASNPLPFDNVMYALHFYAGTHTSWLRERIDEALKDGTPIFVSEWGTSAADGSGGVYLNEAQLWIDFMASRNLSWANWSLCDKGESSAALSPGADTEGEWTQGDLSDSGKFVFSNFK